MALFFAALFAGALFLVAGQSTYWRLSPSDEPRIRLFSLWAAASVLVAGLAGFAGGAPLPDLAGILAGQTAFVGWYFFFYTGVARSVSVTLLIDLAQRLGRAELFAKYRESSRFDDRLALLGKMGWIEKDGDDVTLTPRGAAVARRLARWGSLLGHGLSG